MIRPQFDEASPFSEGRAPVRIGSNTGYIDPTGAAATPMHFSTMLPFREGRAVISSGPAGLPGTRPSWGYIDLDGKIVIAPQYDRVSYFSEGLAAAARDGKAGFIDSTGSVVIPFEFERAIPFASGRAGVRINGKWGFIDRTGKFVIPAQYNNAYSFTSDGLALVERDRKTVRVPATPTLDRIETTRGVFGFIDTSGRTIVPFQFAGAYDFSSGLAPVNFAGA